MLGAAVGDSLGWPRRRRRQFGDFADPAGDVDVLRFPFPLPLVALQVNRPFLVSASTPNCEQQTTH